jgi:hypothetical protein
MAMFRVIAVVSILSFAGCDGGKDGPTDLSPAAKAKADQYCAQRQTYIAECSPGAGPCPDTSCLAQLAEEGPLIEFFDCQLAKTCPMFFSDDDCVEAAGTSDAERDAFITGCQARLAECGADGEYCIVGLPLFRKKWMHAFDACLAGACADIPACIQAVGLVDCFR